jgi:hypothetical protein
VAKLNVRDAASGENFDTMSGRDLLTLCPQRADCLFWLSLLSVRPKKYHASFWNPQEILNPTRRVSNLPSSIRLAKRRGILPRSFHLKFPLDRFRFFCFRCFFHSASRRFNSSCETDMIFVMAESNFLNCVSSSGAILHFLGLNCTTVA